MEHEVFVPFAAGTVRQALVDPARVAHCVPGFQRDADEAAQASDTLVGRLRLRIAGSTITYRGSLHVTEQDGGDLAVEGEGKEARGDGSVKLALIIRLTPSEGGTILGCTGTVTSGGRLAASDDDDATALARRLLDRFAAKLTTDLQNSPPGAGAPSAPEEKRDGGAAEEDGARSGTSKEAVPKGTPEETATGDTASHDVAPEPVSESAPESEPESAAADGSEPEAESEVSAEPHPDRPVDPEALNGSAAAGAVNGSAPAHDEAESPEALEGPEAPDSTEAPDGVAAPVDRPGAEPTPSDSGAGLPEPPPDGALARRTMIGRSAEEVDHSPPRGRYAPVPAPEPLAVSITLRWAAPAAAVVVASAVVIGRLLRRRRP